MTDYSKPGLVFTIGSTQFECMGKHYQLSGINFLVENKIMLSYDGHNCYFVINQDHNIEVPVYHLIADKKDRVDAALSIIDEICRAVSIKFIEAVMIDKILNHDFIFSFNDCKISLPEREFYATIGLYRNTRGMIINQHSLRYPVNISLDDPYPLQALQEALVEAKVFYVKKLQIMATDLEKSKSNFTNAIGKAMWQ